MKQQVELVQVVDSKDPILELLSRWIYGWWAEEEGYPIQRVKACYERSVFSERLPQTYVAFAEGTPVGTFQFGMDDCYVRPDVYPWIKNVYIDLPYRRRGFATSMLQAAAARAKTLGLTELYLFTHLTGLYESCGWRFIEEFETFEPALGRQRLYVQTL